MGRITPFIAALVVAMSAGCKRERSEAVSTPKTTEPSTAAAAQDEAEAALDTAREAKATADSALETAREAQAAAANRTAATDTPGAWWNRAAGTAPPAATQAAGVATEDADRVSVAGRVTESGPNRLVIEPIVGTPLAAQVDAATSVTIDGHAASPAQLTPGTEVRLLYRLDGAQVIAERVDVQH